MLKDEFRNYIVTHVNDLVNIPFIPEKVEAGVIGLVFDLVYPILERYHKAGMTVDKAHIVDNLKRLINFPGVPSFVEGWIIGWIFDLVYPPIQQFLSTLTEAQR